MDTNTHGSEGCAGSFDIAAARENLRRRNLVRREGLVALAEQARVEAERIIRMLIEKYHPVRVYQWGSLLMPDRFREWSDIDIALEGLADPLDGLRALDEASQLTPFPVDIVELERLHPSHGRTIREEGRLVYDRTAAGKNPWHGV